MSKLMVVLWLKAPITWRNGALREDGLDPTEVASIRSYYVKNGSPLVVSWRMNLVNFRMVDQHEEFMEEYYKIGKFCSKK